MSLFGSEAPGTPRGGKAGSAPSSGSAGRTLTAPAPPQGGGAIRGIDETFEANPVNGMPTLSVPLAHSPGRAGFRPDLMLLKKSATCNRVFGFGWNLSLPAITRKTDTEVPRFQDEVDSDVFALSGAEDLATVLHHDGTRWRATRRTAGGECLVDRHRPRVEGLFARVERWAERRTCAERCSIGRDNVTTFYAGRRDRRRSPEDD